MANGNGHKIYRFDGFSLDTERLMLYGADGAVELPPKVIKTLAVLVENQGEIISKDELIGAVWNDSIVEESNLSQYLYLLRKTLGKRPDGVPYIVTLRRRGYRFTAEAVQTREIQKTDEASLTGSTSAARHHSVERRGNVLKVVDWSEAEPEPGSVLESGSIATGKWKRIFSKPIVITALVAALAATSAYTVNWSLMGGSAQAESVRETSITRLTNGTEITDATISPDGKYFTYHEPDGKMYRMYVQQTGQSTRHEIVAASERIPLTKTFTPDSQYIYFLAKDSISTPGSLYRVPTLGGPVTKIVAEIDSGVSFSPDGREMVYYRHDKDGARFVTKASDGSGDEKVIYQTTPGLGYAAWSPDGRSIVIQSEAKREGLTSACSLAAVDLETTKVSPLSDELWDTCARMEWAPGGQGLYMIGTRLGETMTTRREQVFYISYPQGKSRKVTHDGSRHQWSSLGVTSDGAVLAVPFNRSSQIWAMSPDGKSRSASQLTNGHSDGRSGIASLADGRIGYIARNAENVNVWIMNQDGSDQRPITDSPNAIEELRPGADGRYLVFSAMTDDKRSHLHRVNTDGTGLRQITTGEGREIDSSISNDGKWIAYDSAITAGTKVDISLWKQSLEDGQRISLNRNDCQMPHFSPDDKYISCVRDQKDILILSSVDGTLIRTISVPQAVTLSHSINFGARWTPDGKAVAYIVNEKGISNIWVHPVNGGPAERLTDFTGGSIYHFAYSLDGSRLYVARGHQIRDAILIRAL
jgi:Tol biopolymer transport system component/DNA-binding winged helix-turn-helix (wHTH) protein